MIGTGASAIQTVPQIQPQVEHLTIFQRTAPWVVPHRDRPITEFERRLYRRVPAAQRAVRTMVYVSREALVPGLAYRPQLMNAVQKMAEGHLAKQVPDEAIRAKLTPDYVIAASASCRRTSGIRRLSNPTSRSSRAGSRRSLLTGWSPPTGASTRSTP